MAMITMNVRILDGDFANVKEEIYRDERWKKGLDGGLRSLRIRANPDDESLATVETEWRDLEAYRAFASETPLEFRAMDKKSGVAFETTGKPVVRVDDVSGGPRGKRGGGGPAESGR